MVGVLILYKTYKRTHVAFFFLFSIHLFWIFSVLSLSTSPDNLAKRMTNDPSVCHRIWLQRVPRGIAYALNRDLDVIENGN